MRGAFFSLANLTGYRNALDALAPGLAADVRGIQLAIAKDVRDELRAAYPLGETGKLRASVSVRALTARSPAAAVTKIAVSAPYVWRIEYGSVHLRAHPTFGPTMRRARAANLQEMVQAARARGLEVPRG
jgi:hypothetical protein